jgi:hypothetical protein
MLCGDSTFTRSEIEEILSGDGLIPKTEEFNRELRRRFMQTEYIDGNREPLYVEN